MHDEGTRIEGDRDAISGARYGATLRGLDFSSAELTSVAGPEVLWMDRCRFVGADLRQATLDGWRLKRCDLSGADLRGASLRGTSFAACDLTGADLRGADLSGARFGSVGVSMGAVGCRLDGVLVDPGVELSQD